MWAFYRDYPSLPAVFVLEQGDINGLDGRFDSGEVIICDQLPQPPADDYGKSC